LTTDPRAIVEEYLHAVIRDKDFDAASALLADEVVYENVGYPRVRGAQRIVKIFRRANVPKVSWDVTIHRIAQQGASVLTERTDAIIVGRFRADFWVFGVFEVHDGRIALWRDYFDVYDLLKGMARGLLAMAFPARRRVS
jgi:limonene-1,2-epoxide hydrolase